MSGRSEAGGEGAIDAVIFDMDGVVTDTAVAHFAAWKAVFDEVLRARAGEGASFEPFTTEEYLAHVDGVPREAGVRRFLRSRGIELPEGGHEDESLETVRGIGNSKNARFRAWLSANRVPAFDDARALVAALRRRRMGVGIFSASRNMARVLRSAGVERLFDAKVDGVDAANLGLAPKPGPATLVETARRLGAEPAATMVVEDAVSGVQAGAAGGFALIVGVNRQHRDAGAHERALRAHGAHVVVTDLRQLLTTDGGRLAPPDVLMAAQENIR